mmetsp:Transcript_25077/g.32552  ORF Transcript_25077/g.32552 Transcript_25077/m.32552 type:complete len:586 (-) Transcript_25077:241-1998(-)
MKYILGLTKNLKSLVMHCLKQFTRNLTPLGISSLSTPKNEAKGTDRINKIRKGNCFSAKYSVAFFLLCNCLFTEKSYGFITNGNSISISTCSSQDVIFKSTQAHTSMRRSNIFKVHLNEQVETEQQTKRVETEQQMSQNQTISSTADLMPLDESETVLKNPEALTVISLLFGVGIICALDRVAMSVALLPMAKEFGYTETDKGAISAAFTLGYMVAMTPAGLLASFASPTKVLAGGVGLWSIAQMLSPAAALNSISTLLGARFCMGLAESVTVPTLQALVAKWVPPAEKAKILSFVISGLQIGTVLAYQASPALIESLDWPGVFLAYGAFGFVWLLFWLPLSNDDPPYKIVEIQSAEDMKFEEQMKKSKEETKGPLETLSDIPWGGFVKSKEVVALAVAHMAQNWGLYLLLAWLPTYFSRMYGETLARSSTSSTFPFIAAIICGNLGGIMADYLISQEILSTTNCRKLFQTLACVGPAVCMHLLAQVPDSSQDAILLFTAAGGFGAFGSSGHAAGTQDLAKKYTGTIYGATSALAVLAGSAGTYVTGVLLDQTGQFSTIFEITAAVYLAGAAWFVTQFESKRVFE